MRLVHAGKNPYPAFLDAPKTQAEQPLETINPCASEACSHLHRLMDQAAASLPSGISMGKRSDAVQVWAHD